MLHEAARTGGFGAEVAAEVAQAAFAHLDAPPVRVGGADLPVPFSKALESEVLLGPGASVGGGPATCSPTRPLAAGAARR